MTAHELAALNLNSDTGIFDENVGLQRAKEQLLKQQLKSSLKTLPAPKNEYEIDFAAAIPEQKPELDDDAPLVVPACLSVRVRVCARVRGREG